jgi:Cof subfamily protein (haloacid dehalogenase superfamily)
MSDWRPRLIASDMDGTLLRSDDTVGEATVAELGRWRDDGVPVVLATGRPPRWMHRIREVLGYGTAVCCNGAVLLDLERFEILHEEPVLPDVLRSVTDELRRRQPGTWFAVEYGLEFRHEPVYRPRWDVNAPGVAVATLEEMVANPVAKLLARHEDLPRDEFVSLVEEIVGDRATVTHSGPDALAEISAAGVTKASGLAHVAAEHGVGPEDVVVFGDMPNDIAAFEWVRAGGGRAVAMAHAHPDLLAVATDVTVGNDEDGVAAFLATL